MAEQVKKPYGVQYYNVGEKEIVLPFNSTLRSAREAIEAEFPDCCEDDLILCSGNSSARLVFIRRRSPQEAPSS